MKASSSRVAAVAVAAGGASGMDATIFTGVAPPRVRCADNARLKPLPAVAAVKAVVVVAPTTTAIAA